MKRAKRNKVSVCEDSRVSSLLKSLTESKPLLQLQIPSNHKSHPLELNLDGSNAQFLSALLFPLSLSDFFDVCFRKHAVHIQSNDFNRAQQIADTFLFSLDTEQILQNTSSENIFLWLRSDNADTLQSVEISDPKTAFLLHKAGSHAVYCRAPPTLEQIMVSALLEATGLGCGQYDPTGEKSTSLGRGEVEVFVGTKGHLTNWHTDFQENFTIQLSGRKKWVLKQGTVQHPLRAITPHYHSPDTIESQMKSAKLSNPDFTWGLPDSHANTCATRAFGDEMHITMNPGDVLYFPAGMWHKVETVEAGISINVSLMAMSYASLVCRSLEHYLLRKSDWRETIWNRRESDGPHPILSKMDTLLDDLLQVITEFKTNASECILPPVLLTQEHHHEYASSDNDMDSEEDDSKSSTKELIISVSRFVGPAHWSCNAPSKSHVLSRNPLASLIPWNDMSQEASSPNLPIYVLNVNFAGHDSHESLIRVLLRDDTEEQSLARFYEYESKSLPINYSPRIPPCLIYYGYLVWSRNEIS